MYCRFCGTKNEDSSRFCRQCGQALRDAAAGAAKVPVPKPEPAPEPASEPEPARGPVPEGYCPECGAPGDCCTPVVKTDVKTSGGGYGFWNGCCGYILLGPVGLLCGACGGSTKTKVTSRTWRICSRCGCEFMTKQSALETAYTAMGPGAVYTLFIMAAFGALLPERGGLLLKLLLLLAVVGIWCAIPLSYQESTHRSIGTLTDDEKVAFWGRLAACALLPALVGFLWGYQSV